MRFFKRCVAFCIVFCLAFEQSGFAQVAPHMGVPAYLSGLLAQDRYRPVHLRSISIDPQTDRYTILLDKGDSRDLKAPEIEATTRKLLEYFKIGVALPNSMFWVNLRPDSDANIIDPYLERTDMGKVFLAADVQLKKDLARFTSPDTREGREYWNKLYAKAAELFGAQENITIPTVARPWIVPGEIILKQTLQGAYVHKAVMKVCLEQDWIKAQTATNGIPEQAVSVPADARFQTLNAYSAQLLRALVIPRLTREVNSSKRYSELRQVFYSLVLAQWYKAGRRAAGAADEPGLPIDSKDLAGLISQQPWSKQDYYRDYRRSFQEGEYNKQEQVRAQGGIAIRRYFSGGVAGAIDPSSIIVMQQRGNSNGFQVTPDTFGVEISPEGIMAQVPDGGASLEEQPAALSQPARDRVIAALDQRIAGGKRARNAAFISMAISGIFFATSFYLDFATTATSVISAFAALVTFASGMISKTRVDHYQWARTRLEAAETLIPQDVIRIVQPLGDFHGIAGTPFAIVFGAMTASLLQHGAYLLFNSFFVSAYIALGAITGLLAYKLWDELGADVRLEEEADDVVAEASGDKEEEYRDVVAAARRFIASRDNYSAEYLEEETNVLYLQELIAQIDALADSRGASGLVYRENDIKAMAQRRLLAQLISNRYTQDPVPFSDEYRRYKWSTTIFQAMYNDHDGAKKKALRSPYWDTVGIDLSRVAILTELDVDRLTESIIASTREEQDGGMNDFSESGWKDYQAQRARDNFERETYERELREVERNRYFSSGDPDKDRAIAEGIARERTDGIMRNNPVRVFRDNDGGEATTDDPVKAPGIGDELNDKNAGIDPVGGIDFRAVPVVPAAPAAVPAIAAHPATLRQLEQDWNTISRKMEQGEVPYAALKEYAASCAAQKEARKQLLEVSACVNSILRMEEDAAVATSAEMKEILAIIG